MQFIVQKTCNLSLQYVFFLIHYQNIKKFDYFYPSKYKWTERQRMVDRNDKHYKTKP